MRLDIEKNVQGRLERIAAQIGGIQQLIDDQLTMLFARFSRLNGLPNGAANPRKGA